MEYSGEKLFQEINSGEIIRDDWLLHKSLEKASFKSFSLDTFVLHIHRTR